jgi:hypothetical protein
MELQDWIYWSLEVEFGGNMAVEEVVDLVLTGLGIILVIEAIVYLRLDRQ